MKAIGYKTPLPIEWWRKFVRYSASFGADDRLLGSYWLFNNSELGNAVWRNQYRKSACVRVSRIELDWLVGTSHRRFPILILRSLPDCP